jgi:hypothetical protein
MGFSKHQKRRVWPYIFLEVDGVDVLTKKFSGTRTALLEAEHRIDNANNDLARQ